MAPSPHVLTASLQKRTPPRSWCRALRQATWHALDLTLHTDATVSARGQHSYLIVPGGARQATHAEQLQHDKPHLLVLTVVPEHADDNPTASKQTQLYAARDAEAVERWVLRGNEKSYGRMAVSADHPFIYPFLHAWGHVRKLRAKSAVAVARGMGCKLGGESFTEVWKTVFEEPVPRFVEADQFVKVMTHVAIKESLKSIRNAAGTPTQKGPVVARVLAAAIGHEEKNVVKVFEQHGVEKVNSILLMHMLFHPSNSAIDPEAVAAKHDMTQPLNCYLISSSHNTYLKGDQLQSDSTAEMYRVVLERGCRCVEIDAWDGDDGSPIVRHGHTVTSSETLQNVLNAIRDHAFSHGNTCPVILSIENHMSREQQVVAADMIRRVFGDSLYIPEQDQSGPDTLPSPAALDKKIVIKAKTGRSVMRPQCSDADGSADFEDDDSDEPGPPAGMGDGAAGADAPSPGAVSKIVPELCELTFLGGGNRKALAALWKEGRSGKEMYVAASCASLNEKKLLEVFQAGCLKTIREYNSHGLTRVYPKGTRVDSSNYNPMLGHFLGCQIVALNWQSHDSAFSVNEARFLANNGCGYVLPAQIGDAEMAGVLEIHILSAFLLPKPKSSYKRDVLDPYCYLRVFDTEFDDAGECCTSKFETNAVKSNGFAPSWQQSVSVPIVNRALAVLSFKIMDKDRTSGDDVVGCLAVPVHLLRTGVRSLPLNGKDGTPLTIPGTSQRPALLVDIRWK